MSPADNTLLLRADASPRMGTGHVMRCLALGQAWQDAGGRVQFLTAAGAAPLEPRLAAEGFALERLAAEPGSLADAKETRLAAERVGASWIVADGYHFGAGYQRALKEAGHPVLALDDYGHTDHYAADLVLNQNLGADESAYASREACTTLLLGTKYVLLRRDFQRWRGWQREVAETARRVLVTLGGSDPDNVTAVVVEALKQAALPDLEAVVVAGASNPRYESLVGLASGLPGVRVLRDSPDLPERMAWADLAVGAGGTTSWERAFLQLPTLVAILADNQRSATRHLDAAGAAKSLGEPCELAAGRVGSALRQLAGDRAARRAMAEAAGALVDGYGGERVVARLRGARLWLRRVVSSDRRLLWEWANDPQTRASAFQTAPIPWEDHCRWFAGKLANPGTHLFIAHELSDEPVGQLRFDTVCPREVEVHVSVAPSQRGRGLATPLIAEAVATLFRTTDVRVVRAQVKDANTASRRAFERAGFRTLPGSAPARGVVEFVLDRADAHNEPARAAGGRG